ncbi:hypothetical protein [Streptomyces sp. 3N207]|uniref:hypothetical protein n=1 Tax=Streptomyces sp. 3N207 TaxID=3457417 RepID=UPI003FCFADFB
MVFAWLREAFRRKAAPSLDTYEADAFAPYGGVDGQTIAYWADDPQRPVLRVHLTHLEDWHTSQSPAAAAARELAIDPSTAWKHWERVTHPLEPSSSTESFTRALLLASGLLKNSDPQAIAEAAHTLYEALPIEEDEGEALPDITEEEAAAVGSEAGTSLEYALARLFLRLGPPPEPTAVEYAPASSGGGGTPQ